MENTNYFYQYSKEKSAVLFDNRADKEFDLSIVIPTYKRVSLLRQTLLSVMDQQPIKHLRYEVVVVSNDIDFQVKDLKLTFKNLNIVIFANEKNIGMCGNMNRCATLASGKYVAYLQDDDLLLNNYLSSIEQLIDQGIMEGVGCLIPNRYYFFDDRDYNSTFGVRAKRKERIKENINRFIKVGCKGELLQRVYPRDCYKLLYNCYGGGPTCGMVFDRNLLLASEGFDPAYPYAFDFIFFLRFSEQYKVVLLNKTLAVYRMTDSASNKPQVQYDFFRSEEFLIRHWQKNWGKRINEDILRKFFYDTKSEEAQKLIRADYTFSRCSKIGYLSFRIFRYINLMRSGLYRREVIDTLPVRKS